MEELFNKTLQYENSDLSIDQRKELLSEISVGISDILSSCVHVENSASDEDIIDIEHKNLKDLLLHNLDIDTLIYTSEFVKKQINCLCKTYHSIDKVNNKRQMVKIGNKEYKVRILFSPSPQALRNMGKNGADRRKEQYRDFLIEH
jgi:hypothetical protein